MGGGVWRGERTNLMCFSAVSMLHETRLAFINSSASAWGALWVVMVVVGLDSSCKQKNKIGLSVLAGHGGLLWGNCGSDHMHIDVWRYLPT